MAKFKNLDLILDTNERAVFGSNYESFVTYSGGELFVSKPIKGQLAILPEHLVRYDQLLTTSGVLQTQIDNALGNITVLDWQNSVINFATAPPPSPAIGARYVVAATGTSGAFVGHENQIAEWDGTQWVFTVPNEGFTLRVEDLNQFYTYDGFSWGLFAATVDHSALSGLDGDDHEQYVLVDGTRGFTGTVSGVSPVQPYHLTTKFYVDDLVSTTSGALQYQLDNLSTSLQGDYVTLGTTQTISGAKTFTAVTTFQNDVYFGNATISGVGEIYTGVLYADIVYDNGRKYGRETVISGASSQAVVFGTPFSDDDYTLVATLTNEIDNPPSIYSTIQGVKTASGFTTYFSGVIDSGNFILEWVAFKGQQNS